MKKSLCGTSILKVIFSFALVVVPVALTWATVAPKDTVWTIDFSKKIGQVKALHGVNGGPFYYGRNQEPIEKYHKEAGFPQTRLHDVNWPHPNAVDIPSIFPDFDADPNDPKSYHFKKTDDYLLPILKNKSEIIFRLGVSIEHVTQYHLAAPKDYKKWVQICTNIIRHYNEGWANGFKYNIKYWEIYNEPDNKPCWTGTRKEFFEFFDVAAKGLKAYDKNLKIGGPAFTNINSSWVVPFLAYCNEKSIPMDFFSWHAYYNNTDSIIRDTKIARNLLDKYGYAGTESHLNEWHYLRSGWKYIFPGANSTREIYDNLQNEYALTKGPEGAVFSANVLMQLQDCPVDMANFFCADYNPLSLFTYYGVPTKVYFAFKQFNQLAKQAVRVKSESNVSDPSLTLVSATSTTATGGTILLSNKKKNTANRKLKLENLPKGSTYEVLVSVTDAKRNDELLRKVDGFKNGTEIALEIPAESVVLIKINQQK